MLLPLTPVESLQVPEIVTPDSGPTFTGAALELLCQCVDREVVTTSGEQKGDWMPILFIMTDGKPSDSQLYSQMIPEVKRRHFGSIIACAAGMKASTDSLRKLTDTVYSLDRIDSVTFQNLFKWVSQSIEVGTRSMGATDEVELPPPPREISMLF